MLVINIDEYRDARFPSYSLLSSLNKGALAYVKDYLEGNSLDDYKKRRSKARDIGSYVDALLFNTPQYIEENFYILTSNYSEGLYTKFITAFIEEIYTEEALIDDIPDDSSMIEAFLNQIASYYPDIFQTAYRTTGFKITLSAVLAKLKKEYIQFIFEKFKAHNKIVLNLEEAITADNTVEALQNGEFTAQYFHSTSERELLTQVSFGVSVRKILSTLPEVVPSRIKVLPDIVEINHVDKWIRGVDVKTREGNAYKFRYDFFKWGYYLQSSLYTAALAIWLKTKQDEEGLYMHYSVKQEFRFVVGSTDLFNSSIFECTVEDIRLGLTGFSKSDGTEVKGVYKLLEDLYWHTSSGYWASPRDIFISDGVQQLNLLNKL